MMALTQTTTWARRLLVLLAMALALALTATTAPIGLPGAPTPAVAATLAELDAGTLTPGIADVRKAFEFCDRDPDTRLVDYRIKDDSPGLGLPDPLGEGKNAWWGLRTAVNSVVKGTGDLVACGFLTKMVDAGGVELGAACGASKGWGGIGSIEWFENEGAKNVPLYQDKKVPDGSATGFGVTQLTDIGWKASVGGTLPVTAQMLDPNTKQRIGLLEATVQAQGGLACLDKGPGEPEKGNPKDGGPRPSQGATSFDVIAVYAAVRDYGKGVDPPKKDELPFGDEKKEPHPPKPDDD